MVTVMTIKDHWILIKFGIIEVLLLRGKNLRIKEVKMICDSKNVPVGFMRENIQAMQVKNL